MADPQIRAIHAMADPQIRAIHTMADPQIRAIHAMADPQIRAIHTMADPQIRAIHAMAASGRFIPYRRRVFPVPNIPAVPEKPVFYTKCTPKNASRTREACFEHRMPLKMRRVPQEAFFDTECQFRTVGGCFLYRISLPYHSQKG